MKIGLNRDINKDRQKLLVTPPDVRKIVIPALRNDPVRVTKLHNLKMLTEKHNDDKLTIIFLIMGARMIAYHFLVENKWHHFYSPLVVPW